MGDNHAKGYLHRSLCTGVLLVGGKGEERKGKVLFKQWYKDVALKPRCASVWDLGGGASRRVKAEASDQGLEVKEGCARVRATDDNSDSVLKAESCTVVYVRVDEEGCGVRVALEERREKERVAKVEAGWMKEWVAVRMTPKADKN